MSRRSGIISRNIFGEKREREGCILLHLLMVSFAGAVQNSKKPWDARNIEYELERELALLNFNKIRQ
jgi:hypothetical protein